MILTDSESPALVETRETLIQSARRRFGAIPGEEVVDHVLKHSGVSEFAILEAAFESILRRWSFAERDGLVIALRPPTGRVLGRYSTLRHNNATKNGKRRNRREPRPYTTELESVRPIRGSCDCPDFIRSSLGICKHLLVVLDAVFKKPKQLNAALREQSEAARGERLVWDFQLPLEGSLDRMAGLRIEGTSSRNDGAGAIGELRRLLERGGPDVSDLEGRYQALAKLHAAWGDGKRRRRLDTTPSAAAVVVEELERAERRRRNAASIQSALGPLRTLKRKLYPYQWHGVEAFLGAGRLLLADDMGLGKTTQAIACCHALFRAGRVQRGLVIVPASLKPQWLREWQDTTDVPVQVLDGSPDERARRYRSFQEGFLIINYEQLLRDAESIQRLSPELVVLDEAQRIKNYATKSAVYVKALTPEYRLVLTGTPMENRLEELASLLDWVDDLALAPKWRLVPWYTMWEGDGSGGGKAGARNLTTLRQRLQGCVVRRVRQEVLDQLPARTDTRVPVEMTPQQLEEHDALTDPIRSLMQAGKRRPLTQQEFLKLMSLLTQQRIISNGLGQLHFEQLWPAYAPAAPDAALLEGLFSPKLIELRRLVTDLAVAQERKIVVFSQWRRMLRLAEWSLRDILCDADLRCAFFTGAERPSQRTRNVVDFHDDPRTRILFLSDAGGVGLNLQRAASACINIELPWNPAVLEQRIGRIYRLGQKRPIDVYNLVSEGSIEARIAMLIGAKRALFTSVFDGASNEVRFDTSASFLTQVERIVDPGVLPEAPTDEVLDAQAEESDAAPAADAAIADAAVADELTASIADHGNGSAGNGSNGSSHRVSNPTQLLFDALRVERTSDGGIRIEAPPDAAASLLGLFDGMAKLLSSIAAPPDK